MFDLKEKTLQSLFWSYLDSFGIYFIKFIFSILIARALAPADYGVVGMIAIFIMIGQILAESGFAMALIQKKDANETDYSTVFWFNLTVSVAIYLVLVLSAPAIAGFFRMPILVSIIRVTGISVVLNALKIVHLSVLSKEMNFRKQAFINFAAAMISGLTGVVLAYKGFAVWALVFQTLSGAIITTIGFWMFNPWRPKLIFCLNSFKTLYRYGSKIFLQGISDIVFTKIYFPLIGKHFSAAQLGYYSNANRFYEVFIRQASSAFCRAIFPSFALLQDQKERLKKNFVKTFGLLAYIMIFLTVILISTAKPFISFFLTSKWLPAYPLMIAFFIEGFFFPLFLLNQNMLCSIGKSGLSLQVDLVKKVLTFVSIFIAFKFGVRALILGQVASSFISFLLSTIVSTKLLTVKKKEIAFQMFPIIAIAITCILFDQIIINKLFEIDWMLLIAKVIFISTLYVLLSLLFKVKEFREIFATVKQKLATYS